jgi:ABC-2 type transport system permease protein
MFALGRKEITQLLRNKQLLFLLVFPPTIQLCLYGFILSPDVKNVNLGVSDSAKISLSRELISSLSENQVFKIVKYTDNVKELGRMVRTGDISTALIIPPEFRRDINNNPPAKIQLVIDGVDAYIGGISAGYANQIIYEFNKKISSPDEKELIVPQTIFLYNPGLKSSWFFVIGVMGMLLTFISSIASSVESIREKDTGTLEQLLMTPASSLEILLAKILPLFILLMGTAMISLFVSMTMFGIPFKGNFLLYLLLTAIYLIIGISIGLLIGTVSQSKQQAILTGFFINLPIVILSGAITPVESMPAFFRYLTVLNPLKHFITIIRGIILKGVGLNILWTETLVLVFYAVVLLSVSSWKYRSQLR